MSLHNPYHIATMGQNSRNTFTLASNGILVDVFIDDLPDIIVPPDSGGGIIPGQEWPSTEEKIIKHRKRITVIATIGGKDYKETVIVEQEPNLTVKDIDVDVQGTDTKPIITISIKRKNFIRIYEFIFVY